MQINTNLLRSSTFRLAAIYLAIFALSVATILAYVYWNTVGLIGRQTDDTIRAEVLGLADQYRTLGVRGVVDVIERRVLEDSTSYYILTDAGGNRLVGNVASLPSQATGEAGWLDFPVTLVKGNTTLRHVGRGYYSNLPSGYRILVGRDVEEQSQFRQLIQRTLYWALGIAVGLGLGGGLLTSRNFLRRIDAITETNQTIMDGDLSRRMPISGTGDELDRLSLSLNEMLEQIERLMAGMKEVTSNVAHDLKTPLTRLRARVETVLRSGNETEYRATLMKTIEESDRLLQTFNSLLSIARAEAGHAREGLQEVNIGNILEEVAEFYEPIVEEAGGSLKINSADGIMVRADRQLMAQVVGNLIDNALKYGGTSNGVEIQIDSKLKGHSVEITVADKGGGIPEEFRERVKGRFVRLDESRSKPGNGLGLSLVASVMKLHGGQFQLDDNAPGLKARLELPLLALAK